MPSERGYVLLCNSNLGLPWRVDEVERDVGGLERGAGAVDGDDEEAAGLEEAVEGPEAGAEQGGDVRQPPEVLRAPAPHDAPERRSGPGSMEIKQKAESSVPLSLSLSSCILRTAEIYILRERRGWNGTHIGDAKTRMEITFPGVRQRIRSSSGELVGWLMMPR